MKEKFQELEAHGNAGVRDEEDDEKVGKTSKKKKKKKNVLCKMHADLLYRCTTHS